MRGSLRCGEPVGVESMKYLEQTIRVELKYCERCGGLWLRRAMSGSTFCDPCEQAEVLMPMKRAKGPRTGVRDDSELKAMVGFVPTVSGASAVGLAVDRRLA